jgi:hypothetical protein
MKYQIYGPYSLPRNDRRIFTRDATKKALFWDGVESDAPGLPDACGCYIISVRNVVWYVGLAESQGFRRECFAAHTITKIDSAITEGAGNPMLHLLAKHTPAGRFARPSTNGHPDAVMLESLLIGIGLRRNEKLLNKSDTAILREIMVPGFYNSPRGAARANSVQSLKQAMGV